MIVSIGQLKAAVLGIALLSLGTNAAWAAARLESAVGEILVTQAGAQSSARAGQRIDTGALVTTGARSNAVLRFDDGQVAVLNQNTTFRIAEYRYQESDPAKDKSLLELVRGALRFISGKLSKRTQEAVQIRTATATIGIRGTDLMAVTGSLGVSVGEGAVVLTNGGGSLGVGAGQLGFVADSATLGSLVSSSMLPPGMIGIFGELAGIPVAGVPLPVVQTLGYATPGGGGVASGAAVSGAAGAISSTTLAVGAAAAVGVAAVVSNVKANDDNSSSPSATSTR